MTKSENRFYITAVASVLMLTIFANSIILAQRRGAHLQAHIDQEHYSAVIARYEQFSDDYLVEISPTALKHARKIMSEP